MANSIKIGSNNASKFYIGSTEVDKIYLGNTEIYNKAGVVEKNYWTINGVRKGITVYSDEKFIGDSYVDPMGIFTIHSLPELGAPLSGTIMGGEEFTLNVGETISDTTSGVNINLKYVNKNTLQINYSY